MSERKGSVAVGQRRIGSGFPVYVIAEIGINHNGSIDIAKKLINGAAAAGCDAVKFQKRTPEICVPRDQWMLERDTPWGRMTYIDYRRRMEFDQAAFGELVAHCKAQGIDWFASCWDAPSIDFIEAFDPPMHKVPSALITEIPLLDATRRTGRPVMMSTGMSTSEQIAAGVAALDRKNLMLAHATSTYPCPVEEVNLRMIETLAGTYRDVPVGYSGHETGLIPTCAAVALGACFVERHVTLDRAMWGSDQAASVEMDGLRRLVGYIRDIERSMGDGVKQVYPSEMASMKRLRPSAGRI